MIENIGQQFRRTRGLNSLSLDIFHDRILLSINSIHWHCRHPKNTNVVEGMVKALARVVSNVQV
jgi:hypothetical protein